MARYAEWQRTQVFSYVRVFQSSLALGVNSVKQLHAGVLSEIVKKFQIIARQWRQRDYAIESRGFFDEICDFYVKLAGSICETSHVLFFKCITDDVGRNTTEGCE